VKTGGRKIQNKQGHIIVITHSIVSPSNPLYKNEQPRLATPKRSSLSFEITIYLQHDMVIT
jgi:hypothetical protein